MRITLTSTPRLDAPLLVTQLRFTSTCGAAVRVPLRTTFVGAAARVADAPDLDVAPAHSAVAGSAAFAGTSKTAEPSCMGVWPGGSGELTGNQRCTLGDPSARPAIAVVYVGLGRVVALYYCLSTLHRNR